MQEQEGKKEKKYFSAEDSYVIVDVIVTFLGIGVIFLSALSAMGYNLDTFIFGATLGSFLLVLGDYILINQKLSGFQMTLYGLCFIFGVFSLTFVPTVLNLFPNIFLKVESISGTLTLVATGIVLIIIGVKSAIYKADYRYRDSQKIKGLEKQLIEVRKELEVQRNLVEEKVMK